MTDTYDFSGSAFRDGDLVELAHNMPRFQDDLHPSREDIVSQPNEWVIRRARVFGGPIDHPAPHSVIQRSSSFWIREDDIRPIGPTDGEIEAAIRSIQEAARG